MRFKRCLEFFLSTILVFALSASCFAASYQGKKILFIDSYHQGYPWSDGVTEGVKSVIEPSGAELKIIRMDTKRNKSDDFKKEAALKAKAVIEQFKPDVVIASDDNASKYIIVPYFKDGDLPFVFCGLNWDASIYGFPMRNVTGMVEVSPVPQLLEQLKPFAKGNRVGHLAGDVTSARKEGEYIKKIFGLDLVEVYAKDLDDWKKGFKEIQDKVDMLIVGNTAGIVGWDNGDAAAFAVSHTKIPTGATQPFIADYAMITFGKVSTEQGAWAAQSALKILDGTSPADIPIVKNKEGELIVNVKIAQASGFEIPFELVQSADKVIE